jgi:hypothetical protein
VAVDYPFAHINSNQRESEPEFKSFLLFERGVERITARDRTRGVLTVTLNLHFL